MAVCDICDKEMDFLPFVDADYETLEGVFVCKSCGNERHTCDMDR